MTATFEALLAQAMLLSPTERADLADLLWLSVNSREEVDAAWEAEIAKRIAQLDAGEVECVPMEDVLAGLRKRFRPVD